jgi:glycosyltransferase involved in cell wall biosynthesis
MIDFDSTPVQIDRMGTYAGPKDAKLIANVKWRLFRDKLRSAAVLQAWSRWAKQSAVNEYGIPEERIIVNPPGVDLQFWRPLARLRGETDDRPLRVLFVGADFDRKGGSLLLEWYRGQRPEQVELHIVTREPVEARPGVYLYHNLRPNTAELLDLYQRSDLFVLPSLGECFGIATVEAMAAGLPVIASDVGGTADIIEPGRNGFIVPSADLAQLSEAIGIILRNRQLRSEMSAQSRQLAEERFDLQTNAHRTFEHLRRIARTPQPQGLSLGELPGSR